MSKFIHRLFSRSGSSKSRVSKAPRQLDIEMLEVRSVPSVVGSVFQDSDGNGLKSASEEGISAVTVTAYTPNGSVAATATTNASGSYTLATNPGEYRVAFTNIPTAYFAGLDGDDAILFVRDGETANLALNTRQFVQTNPGVITSNFDFGNALTTTTLGTTPTSASTSGLAYNSVTGAIYAASFTKKHAPYGVQGPSGSPTGVIYQYGAAGSSSAIFADLNALKFGTVAGSNFRADYSSGNELDRDSGDIGWDAVGKTALGGIDVSADGKRVYVMNLADRQLYALGVDTQTNAFDGNVYRASIPNAASVMGATAGPSGSDLRGDLRPFAVTVHNGKIYVGVVNSAESTGRSSDLQAYVFEVADTGFTLRFKSAPVFSAKLSDPGWQAWSTKFATLSTSGIGLYPQPWLTGIAFDASGNMNLTIRDRAGDQFGLRTLDNPDSNVAYTGSAVSETLRAVGSSTEGYATETIGTASAMRSAALQTTSTGLPTPPAPKSLPAASGRIFLDANFNGVEDPREPAITGIRVEVYNSSGAKVGETFSDANGFYVLDSSIVVGGGLKVGETYQIRIPLNQERLADQYVGTTPNVGSDDTIDSDGVVVGTNLVIPLVVTSPTQVTLNLDQGFIPQGGPAPYSIGNRIFADLNRNGLRDANEPGIDGVAVRLYEDKNGDGLPDGPAIQTDVTAEGGYYRFDNIILWTVGSIEKFIVEVDTTSPALTGYSLTSPNTPGDTDIDNDSNGLVVGTGFVRSTSVTLGPGDSEPTNENDFAPTDPGSINPRSNLSVDFGFYLPSPPPPVTYSLGNRVWFDTNENGIRDNGEVGIAGVTVRLFNATGDGQPDGPVFKSTTTNSNGYYRFDGLEAGNYVVEVVTDTPTFTGAVPTLPGQPANADIDNDNNGTILGDGFVRSSVVTLGPGDSEPTNETDQGPGDPGAPNNRSNLSVDFGFIPPPPPPVTYSLGNRVWLDTNRNGIRDNGEVGIAGVTVRLFNATSDGQLDGPVFKSTTTNANGYYRFDGLEAGNYIVDVVTNTPALAGLAPTLAGQPANADIDNDNNGTEIGVGFIASSVITLGPGDSEPTNETDLGPGDPGAPNNRSNLTVDFGFIPPPPPPPVTYSLGNRVWLDSNRNGIRDNGEAGIAGVTVRLFNATSDGQLDGPVFKSTTTNSNGYYRFDGLEEGNYIVEVVTNTPTFTNLVTTKAGAPANANIDNDNNGTEVGVGFVASSVITLGPGDSEPTNETDLGPGDPGAPNNRSNLTVDFGFVPRLPPPPPATYSLGNRVWLDTNRNGVIDAGEQGINGVTVRLYRDTNNDGVADGSAIGTKTTANNGYYRFDNLSAGNYVVEVLRNATLSGLTSTKDGAPANANIDSDDNGSIITSSTVRSTVVTLGPGDSEPTNERDLGPGDPGAPNNRSNLTVDFGFYRPDQPVLLSLGNLVWLDANNDGLRQSTEKGLAGVEVKLLQNNVVINTMTTDADGEYLFTGLKAGDYQVQITRPAIPGAGTLRYTSSTGGGLNEDGSPRLTGAFEPGADPNNNVDNDDNGTVASSTVITSGIITLSPGAEPTTEDGDPNSNLTLDFGLINPNPLVANINRLSGYVYRDTTTIDGIREPARGETGIGGVTVRLTGTLASGVAFTPREAVTNREGFYQFTNLPDGTYTVSEVQPGGLWIDGIDTAGRGGVSQSVVSNDVLQVRLQGGQNSIENNFGEVLPFSPYGYVYYDVNKNGTRDSGEPGIPNVPVTITGTAFVGTPLERPLTPADVPGGLTIVTNSDGFYSFTNVPPGVYTISDVNPPGWIDGPEENVDPNGPTIVVGSNVFSQVTPSSQPLRGPLNFSLQVPPGQVFDPSKQFFLASPYSGQVLPPVVPPVGRANAVGDSPAVPLQPSFNTTTASATGAFPKPTFVATGVGEGLSPTVRVFDFSNGVELYRFNAYDPSFTGGVRVATGDVDGDGIEDIVTAPGVGGGPHIRVYNGKDGSEIASFFAYDSSFFGGVYVSVGDVNGDGKGEIVTGTGIGGGPRVQVFDMNGNQLYNFFAYDSSFRGGVRVSLGDVDGDNRADIITGAGDGGAMHIQVFSGATGQSFLSFIADNGVSRGGAWVTAADIDGDGRAEIVTAPGSGSSPIVRAFNSSGTLVNQFASYEAALSTGVRLASADIDGNGTDEIITVPGNGGSSSIKFFNVATGGLLDSFWNTDPGFLNGSYVG